MKLKYSLSIALSSQLILVIVSFITYNAVTSHSNHSAKTVTIIPKSNIETAEDVTASGRIEPNDGVIKLSADTQDTRVSQILVKEGDRVKQGQVVAILDNSNRLKAAWEQAQRNLQIAHAQLTQSEVGPAKQGEVAAQEDHIASLEAQFAGEVSIQKEKIARFQADLLGQTDVEKAEINRLKAELKHTQTECYRYKILSQNGAVSTSLRNNICLQLTVVQGQLNEAEAKKRHIVGVLTKQIEEEKATLNQILATSPKQIAEAKNNLKQMTEVRPVDVQVAQAQLKQAKTAVDEAEIDLSSAYVKAPADAQVLKIHTFPGERVSSDGIVDLAQIQPLYVIADVFETKVRKIHVGQIATISSSALLGELKGEVEQIGLQIGKKQTFSSDPTLNIDNRVVEVKICLDSASSQQAAGLINLEVEVKIKTES